MHWSPKLRGSSGIARVRKAVRHANKPLQEPVRTSSRTSLQILKPSLTGRLGYRDYATWQESSMQRLQFGQPHESPTARWQAVCNVQKTSLPCAVGINRSGATWGHFFCKERLEGPSTVLRDSISVPRASLRASRRRAIVTSSPMRPAEALLTGGSLLPLAVKGPRAPTRICGLSELCSLYPVRWPASHRRSQHALRSPWQGHNPQGTFQVVASRHLEIPIWSQIYKFLRPQASNTVAAAAAKETATDVQPQHGVNADGGDFPAVIGSTHGLLKEPALDNEAAEEVRQRVEAAIAYEAECGFANVEGSTARFGSFLASQMQILQAPSSSAATGAGSGHAPGSIVAWGQFAEAYAVLGVDERVRCLEEVVRRDLGHVSLADLLAHTRALQEAAAEGLPEQLAREGSAESDATQQGLESEVSAFDIPMEAWLSSIEPFRGNAHGQQGNTGLQSADGKAPFASNTSELSSPPASSVLAGSMRCELEGIWQVEPSNVPPGVGEAADLPLPFGNSNDSSSWVCRPAGRVEETSTYVEEPGGAGSRQPIPGTEWRSSAQVSLPGGSSSVKASGPPSGEESSKGAAEQASQLGGLEAPRMASGQAGSSLLAKLEQVPSSVEFGWSEPIPLWGKASSTFSTPDEAGLPPDAAQTATWQVASAADNALVQVTSTSEDATWQDAGDSEDLTWSALSEAEGRPWNAAGGARGAGQATSTGVAGGSRATGPGSKTVQPKRRAQSKGGSLLEEHQLTSVSELFSRPPRGSQPPTWKEQESWLNSIEAGVTPDPAPASWSAPPSPSLQEDNIDLELCEGSLQEESLTAGLEGKADPPAEGALENSLQPIPATPPARVPRAVASAKKVALGSKLQGPGVLDMLLADAKWLKKKEITQLEEVKIYTVRQLLQHYPRTYINYQSTAEGARAGDHLVVLGTVMSSSGSAAAGKRNLVILNLLVATPPLGPSRNAQSLPGEGPREEPAGRVHVHIRMFKNVRAYAAAIAYRMQSSFPVGALLSISGKVKEVKRGGDLEMENMTEVKVLTDTAFPDASEGSFLGLLPVYKQKGEMTHLKFVDLISRSLAELTPDMEHLPPDVLREHGLMGLYQAYQGVHSPMDLEEAERARQRLVFEELFSHQLGLLFSRAQLERSYLGAAENLPEEAQSWTAGKVPVEEWSQLAQQVLRGLPYDLTGSQMSAICEIMADLRRPVPMSRLMQGDVGCGKTIVAMLALLEVCAQGKQAALMAPTEFLAQQHFTNLQALLESADPGVRPRAALLTGSLKAKDSRRIRQELQSGDVGLVVGTHSLITDRTTFRHLALVVVDEQHKFGVAQRATLNNKGRALENENAERGGSTMPSHLLSMSATPIPRSLALAMHGDMAMTVITDMPPGRTPVRTHVFLDSPMEREEAYRLAREEVEAGGRAFVVFPVIDESENFSDRRAAKVEFAAMEAAAKSGEEETRALMGTLPMGLVHGRMAPAEKEEALRQFKEGITKVLFSTTVIEVGIDIPEASVMLVEHAERYGMAQLHQLRGRVGRGSRAALCLLLGSSPESLERLRTLERSQDGFYLAQMDLELRGPGNLLGKKQAGHLPEFHLARLEVDGSIMHAARSAAEDLVALDPTLENHPLLRAELAARRLSTSIGQ